MNHNLKMKFRRFAKKNSFFSKLYHKAALKKVENLQKLSDEDFLKKKFKENTGKKLNLSNPLTFNEKLQWLKLYDRNPLYTQLVDKYAVREYVISKIGKEYLNELYGVYLHFDDIDFTNLPNQFVIKCNHDCGSIIICKDKKEFNFVEAKDKIEKALAHNYFWNGREWPYKNVKPRIIVEKFLQDQIHGDLRDYKFFCFNGIPQVMFIATERSMDNYNPKFDFFDMDGNHLPFWNDFPNADRIPQKPIFFNEMKLLAAKLSEGIPFVRVDFFECNKKIYFGEMTFYHAGGMGVFHPEEWDKKLGDLIHLPIK